MEKSRKNLDWTRIIVRAREIVVSFSVVIGLRQLFYVLYGEGYFENTSSRYKYLSKVTAELRRNGEFPDLADSGRSISRLWSFEGPNEARQWMSDNYHTDRSRGQSYTIYLATEKGGLVAQLEQWFLRYGFPIVALRGYDSQSHLDEVARDAGAQGRDSVLIYAGDWDASGEDIQRDYVERSAGAFTHIVKVGLTEEQVHEFGLPEMAGKDTDTRRHAFIEKYGRNAQVELDALPPETLRLLYQQAINRFWDESLFQKALRRETRERKRL